MVSGVISVKNHLGHGQIARLKPARPKFETNFYYVIKLFLSISHYNALWCDLWEHGLFALNPPVLKCRLSTNCTSWPQFSNEAGSRREVQVDLFSCFS